jgi:hypothetical protein
VDQHPVDRLIRELIASGRMPDSEELSQIADRMATASFDTRVIPVPVRMQGLVYQNQVRGTIISGYQVSGSEQTGIPEDARWLT